MNEQKNGKVTDTIPETKQLYEAASEENQIEEECGSVSEGILNIETEELPTDKEAEELPADKEAEELPVDKEAEGLPGRKSVSGVLLPVITFFMGIVLTLVVLLAAAIIYINTPGKTSPSSPVSPAAIRKTMLIQDLIHNNYLRETDEKSQADMMYLGMVTGLGDVYSTYYTAEEYEEIIMSHNGQMEGIGVTIAQDEESGYLIVQSTVEEAPAESAGVKVGDLILAINGQDTKGITTTEAVEMIQKSETKTITLKLSRDGEELELSMDKAPINKSVVSGAVLNDEYGYVRINSFNRQTPVQFEEVYGMLREQKVKGLIIDLRGNLGGLVDCCCDTLSMFMPEGPLVIEVDKNGKERTRDCEGKTPIDIPLIVLVDGSTASASEIFAGAVRDYGVGTLVGTVTYGKGVEQNSFTLPDGSVLKLTTKNYYTPGHVDINGTGLVPDVEIGLPKDAASDVQLEKALEILEEEG